ncbi:MAG: AI-2E family transporter [Anaerolineae bacterium]|nr:AI-2E family transporter [Anaerolineae bacterium]
MDESNRQWGSYTKRSVAFILLVLIALIIYRFQTIISPLVIALLLAFILDPIVDFLTDRLRLSRGLATTLVFLVLILVGLGLVATPVAVIPSPRQIVNSIQAVVNDTLTDINAFFERPLEIGEYTLDLSGVYGELSSMVRSYIGSVLQGTLTIAGNIAQGAFWLIFILMAAFYLVKDIDGLIKHIDGLAPPGYQDDFVRLRQRITDVWHAFLRGQLLLALILTIGTAAVFAAIGVPYAWAMGLLAGIMAFVPNIGPIISAVPPILLAFFQGSRFLPIDNFWFAVLVAGAYVLVQLVYNNVLVPRILGQSLNLHPLVVLIAAIVGGLMGGLVGLLLAVPILATLRIIGHYIMCRLYDRDPFAETKQDEKKKPPKRPSLKLACQAGLSRLRARWRDKNCQDNLYENIDERRD